MIPDVALVTSLRDGMNLVSYEFVACQNAKKGVLILSEVSLPFPFWICSHQAFYSISRNPSKLIFAQKWKNI